ncbi:protein lin-52 homolog [Plakobranchus ocellatus]|uniref:Protein lin-52 homolog n=1 Tax=Plakobranchus ocellatus TaxID=259542 RepID=A0AAV4DYG1_9GAST|nr:protein lin-52 homolog [Plakobranchus ocellatus]
MASKQSDDLKDDKLMSFENIDRASPDLWPERIPGVTEFEVEQKANEKGSGTKKWLADLEKDDINLLQEFGSLTLSQLMEKVRGLQNLAYQLGLEEAREMTRGKFLHILARSKQQR